MKMQEEGIIEKIDRKPQRNYEKLIEMIRPHNALYDKTNPKWKDKKFKNNIWQQIGADLGQEYSDCRKKWDDIRSRFRASLKTQAKRNARGLKAKDYKYGGLLDFLRPHEMDLINDASFEIRNECLVESSDDDNQQLDNLSQIKTESSDTIDGKQFDAMDLPELDIKVEVEETLIDISNSVKIEPSVDGFWDGMDTGDDGKQHDSGDFSEQDLKVEIGQPVMATSSMEKPESDFDDFMDEEDIDDEELSSSMNSSDQDTGGEDEEQEEEDNEADVDDFLAGLASELKKLAPAFLTLAQTEIVSIIQDCEKDMLMGNRLKKKYYFK